MTASPHWKLYHSLDARTTASVPHYRSEGEPVSEDRVWPTPEHYFQAQKFSGTSHEEEIRQASSPMIAARMGRSRKRPLRRDWESAKDGIMLDALRAKFGQHEDLKRTLLDTGARTLVEHTPRDRTWADGGDGSGRNRLGVLLMRVRAELRDG